MYRQSPNWLRLLDFSWPLAHLQLFLKGKVHRTC
jgi:hypothetical protein